MHMMNLGALRTPFCRRVGLFLNCQGVLYAVQVCQDISTGTRVLLIVKQLTPPVGK